ncbi:hypothetical protein ACHAWF_014993, partial [Thalassiosira exigua]
PPLAPRLSDDVDDPGPAPGAGDDEGAPPPSPPPPPAYRSSRGAVERPHDSALRRKLRETEPPAPRPLPLLVPRDRKGNRLAIVRGSGRRHGDVEVAVRANAREHEFYKFLREVNPAFEGCRYLLPGLRGGGSRGGSTVGSRSLDDGGAARGAQPVINVSSFGSFRLGHVPGMSRSEKSKLSKLDLVVAKRRVECAIYAFGGMVTRKKPKQPVPLTDKLSIFRTRSEMSSNDATPSPSKVSSRGSGLNGSRRKKGKASIARSNSMARRERYEKKLRQQYFEHGNRLSWDVQAGLNLTLGGAQTFDDEDDGDDLRALKRSGSRGGSSDGGERRKNRCKKCGQIKQGHICPYQSSLQRSIGIMVYPSANAHVADEPGTLAPALCEMNNFIPIKGGGGESFEVGVKKEETSFDGASPGHGTSDVSPFRRKTLLEPPTMTCKSVDAEENGESSEAGDRSEDLIFQPKMEVTLDQFRAITPKDVTKMRRDYRYPQVPLTFSQRKSTSDALFSLSRMVPKLTDECALVLTEARKNNEWDIAVAELMAQVICVLHCSPSKDYTLEGLRRYLLTLGIVC